jgi:hypothetical protein
MRIPSEWKTSLLPCHSCLLYSLHPLLRTALEPLARAHPLFCRRKPMSPAGTPLSSLRSGLSTAMGNFVSQPFHFNP